MKKKKKGKVKKIIFTIVLFIALFAIYSYLYEQEQKRQILIALEDKTLNINEYYIYGTHFNMQGELSDISVSNIKDAKITLLDRWDNMKDYDIQYEIENNTMKVRMSDFINEGIYLDGIEQGKYFCLLKVIYEDNNVKYYSLKNNTNYEDMEYYTITENKKNKRIKVSFEKFNFGTECPYVSVRVENIKLPTNVYDVVIDPGHGGSDPGAVSGKYQEADIVIEYGKALKEALEELGLKVALTRDGTEDKSRESKFNVYSVYDSDGRVNIVGSSKAKYNFSIHVNSLDVNTIRGVEIYAPSKTSLNLAQDLADNIVNTVNIPYSTRDTDKVSNGVYVRTFTEEEIKSSKENAKKEGYTPYNITTDTPYLYMIREVGGMMTGAYIDGRNKDYGKNEYVDSNIGVESYLIELGYIINKSDLNKILNQQDLYIKAIAKAIQENIYE